MECKFCYYICLCLYGLELIDTLWNVNQELVEIAKELGYELIDTLWNVNSEISHLYFLL